MVEKQYPFTDAFAQKNWDAVKNTEGEEQEVMRVRIAEYLWQLDELSNLAQGSSDLKDHFSPGSFVNGVIDTIEDVIKLRKELN